MKYEIGAISSENPLNLTSQYDNDSAFGESLASSTTSLRSVMTKYEFEHGRRYHAYKAGRKQKTRIRHVSG